ncbi:MAG: aa3-type cytochrome c oxidase subunit IV [Paracoccus sp. (in: a-proteobacteria)]|nr:aa3-type cytochrome c oxidase subunit IV [Paracoccus sp. (in: a-proteobacteria)]
MAQHHEITDHKHGTMDVTEHERTFDGFIRLLIWGAVSSLAVVIFLALANA